MAFERPYPYSICKLINIWILNKNIKEYSKHENNDGGHHEWLVICHVFWNVKKDSHRKHISKNLPQPIKSNSFSPRPFPNIIINQRMSQWSCHRHANHTSYHSEISKAGTRVWNEEKQSGGKEVAHCKCCFSSKELEWKTNKGCCDKTEWQGINSEPTRFLTYLILWNIIHASFRQHIC